MSILIWSFASLLSAQTPAAYHLDDIKSASVLVEHYDNIPCAPAVDDVRTSVNFILGQSAIKIRKGAKTYVYIALNFTDNCAAVDVTLEVLAPVRVVDTNTLIPTATIWDDGTLLTGASDMRSRILATVEEECKRFVVDWNSMNKR
ncbi:MAG: hypothetical protein WCF17_09615 [Terracidiphilus sp.]